ncbi:hypothetical protein J2T56_001104 [Natronobacillus azotifigens]
MQSCAVIFVIIVGVQLEKRVITRLHLNNKVKSSWIKVGYR